ncbi:Ribosomal RNA small subunit methyltransferase I [Sphaerochaeta globosa str. Buddy]|uniref:Ribosomal RNA small subunit methyltransferase I n=2 Tax=Sphaerochaeta TaxID=399320 RepID=F0RTP1_SPHGB|nr:Ribosomal RNA small subunit methyltransferase I [Sphaerochaeta globosa str. Buddy]
MRMSTFYMVATPIGNLEDITYRAVQTLKSVDVIACEDTRHTQQLLTHYEISKRLIACHAHNEINSAKGIVELLASGLDVAFVSDAGTPGISDPGARVVTAVRQAGFTIVPIPGASAVAALVSVAGFVGKSFTFEGFLSPRKGRRTKRLQQLLEREEAFILYESPFRIVKTLQEIATLDATRSVVAGREMTKKFEEFLQGTAAQIAATLTGRDAIKGEFAVLVAPKQSGDADDNDSEA